MNVTVEKKQELVFLWMYCNMERGPYRLLISLDLRQYENDLMESICMFVLKLPRFLLAYTVREKARQFQNSHTFGLRRVVLILSKL